MKPVRSRVVWQIASGPRSTTSPPPCTRVSNRKSVLMDTSISEKSWNPLFRLPVGADPSAMRTGPDPGRNQPKGCKNRA